MRWEGPASGVESLSCPSPSSATSGNPGFCPLGNEVEKQDFRTAWDIAGQKFQGGGLKLKDFILTFEINLLICGPTIMRIAESGDLKWDSCSWIWDFPAPMFCDV